MKLLFIIQSLKIGGVEKALLEQVNHLSREHDVSLLLFSEVGGYEGDLDQNVKVIRGSLILNCIGQTKAESKKSILAFIIRNIIAVVVKLLGRCAVYKFLYKFEKTLYGYDIAISYVNDQDNKSMYCGCNQFLLQKVIAEKKVGWIHSDPACLSNLSVYKEMDAVVNVSLTMKNKFDEYNVVPQANSYLVYNRLDIKAITDKSKEFIPFTKKCIHIVTVGRLEELKGTMELLEVATRLKCAGYSFQWHFVGDGSLKAYCQQYIHAHDLNQNVFLEGNYPNPYPYIVNSDICVSGSKVETFGLNIIESLVLKVPVIAYRYEAISELLDGVNGIICNTYDEIYDTLVAFLENISLLEKQIKQSRLLIDYNKLNNNQFINLIRELS